MTGDAWWRHAVIYQVYVWSFADSDGDGIGDLPGVRSRLPYLRDLGVDAVWLNPFYPSPQADNGYDVTDHRGVDPRFGTLADMDALIEDAHAVGLRILLDLVPNHTSDQHPWFRGAIRGGPERARYLFRDGRGAAGEQPPNNWRSVFGGPAWTRTTEPDGTPGQWYLHLFAPEQPDLDWTSPDVRAEFVDILRFWLDRGADGFRIDVAHGLAKDPQLPDVGAGRSARATTASPHWDLDEVHGIYREWRRVLDSYPGERVFVGEIPVDSPDRLALYLRPGELHTAFNFGFLTAAWDAAAIRSAIDETIRSLEPVGAPATWVLSNHDVVRHVTRYGSAARARAAALLMLALPGGAYVYQGDELGLPEVEDLPSHARRDPSFTRTGGAEIGRDGCRVPLPWSGSAPSFGFGPGPASWLPQPHDWGSYAVSLQTAEPDSMLSLYRAALRHRPLLEGEKLTWLPSADDVLAFRCGPSFSCVVNLGSSPAPLPFSAAALILASGPVTEGGPLPGTTAAWYDCP